jgi:hypothetical protein
MRANSQAAEQTPEASTMRQRRKIRYTRGLDKNDNGNEAAIILHANDPTTVVIRAPRRPVLKNACIIVITWM